MGSDDLNKMMGDINASYARMVKVGAQAERDKLMPYFLAIIAAYDRAQLDPAAKIPTGLMLAVEAARQLQDGANPYAERRATPRYQPRRDGGDDMSVKGAPLRPGE